MSYNGHSLIEGQFTHLEAKSFQASDPAKQTTLPEKFFDLPEDAVDTVLAAAHEAYLAYRETSAPQRAAFLRAIGEEIENLGDELIERVQSETALPKARVEGERARTVGQLNSFADLLDEGSWVDARIDTAIPDRQPLPKPDLRRRLEPIGPVVVFGSSNFPLAFSVAGGDIASALAAGNPVIKKAHRAHPGTSELVGRAILKAIERAEMPPGVFALIHGRGSTVGQALIRHPATKAVGFTGSQSAGRALFDAAAARPEPIPVFAEMSSLNPVVVLPGALKENRDTLVEGLLGSITLGVGQFCTKPGLVFAVEGADTDALISELGKRMAATEPAALLHPEIADSFRQRIAEINAVEGVSEVAAADPGSGGSTRTKAWLSKVSARTFLETETLHEEAFGPFCLVVTCQNQEEIRTCLTRLSGQLTGTLHGSDSELSEAGPIIAALRERVGRLIFQGYPTGVEVCPSMTHGGPYPATTDSRFTAVGTAAIQRFVRPVSYQNCPAALLPEDLQDANPRKLLRIVNGVATRDPVA
jgi:NADP-dependent aldehyde dehydrogenase